MKKTLEESMKERGLTKFTESFSYNVPKENIEVFEKGKLTESSKGEFFAEGVLRNVPVTGFEVNLNKRRYGRDLWRRVKESGAFEGSLCMADHSENANSVKDISGVWKNFKVNETHATADFYAIGEYGKTVLSLARLSQAGFSTSGYGSLLEDGITVDPATYEYTTTDFVIDPSQQVYATIDNVDEADYSPKITKKVEEALFESDLTNNINKQEKLKEDTEMSEALKLQEGNLKNQARQTIKEAKSSSSFKEAIEDLKGFKECVPETMVDTLGKIDSAIFEIQEKMDSEIVATKSLLEEQVNDNDGLQAKLDIIESSNIELTERLERATSLLNKANRKKVGNRVDSRLEEKYSRGLSKMEEEKVAFDEDSILRDNDISILLEDMELIKFDRDILIADLKEAKADVRDFARNRAKLEADLFEEVEIKERAIKHIEALSEAMREIGYEANKFYEKEEDEKKAKDKDEKKPLDKKPKKGDEKDDKEKKEESSIRSYFRAMVENKPAVKDIKREILTSNSLKEAITLTERYLKNDSSSFKLTESVLDKDDSWIPKGML